MRKAVTVYWIGVALVAIFLLLSVAGLYVFIIPMVPMAVFTGMVGKAIKERAGA